MRGLATKTCEFLTDPPHLKDPLGVGDLEPILQIVPVGVGG